MPSEREAVVANAKYLREVRPIDPEAVADYVEGGAHPAVVRRVLREEAVALELVERPDGTFVPAPEGPVEPAFDGVSALPERHERALADLLVEAHGTDWHRGESGDRLRETVRRLKADYYRQRPVEYDREAALAYAVYHLADFYAATQYVLDELGRDGLLDHRLRVLDVGAGVGGPALGLADYLPGDALVDYHAVEPSAAADVLASLLEGAGRNVHPTIHRTTAEAFAPDGEYDLVLFANVLSELDDPAAVLADYLDCLSSDGTLVATAPADRNTSVGLRAAERTLVREGRATVYAPAVWLWPGEHPTDEGWSFDRRPDVAVPAPQERLAAGAEDPAAMRNTSVKFSYSLLRTDGRRRYDLALSESDVAKMAAMDRHVTDRVDLVAAKLSRDLSEGGRDGGHGDAGTANPVFKVSDGSEDVSHYAVLVRETSLNRTLREAGYGALLRFENALVLWNDDEEAYNLVVDEDCVVDPA